MEIRREFLEEIADFFQSMYDKAQAEGELVLMAVLTETLCSNVTHEEEGEE